jgi:hypothetical protein
VQKRETKAVFDDKIQPSMLTHNNAKLPLNVTFYSRNTDVYQSKASKEP